MNDVAVRVENLGKRYRIGEITPLNDLREVVAHAVSAPFRRFRASSNNENVAARKTIWALKEVSFEVKQGEVVGVIGRNGAGKTTLLKVLSRITGPTEGRAELNGRVGSLLEVGTGFHGDLTGRENVYLNGAILGMKKAEISRKFDEIVAFAGVEQFIDTPVKRYSTGMGTRLAFAVAAHLEPEILLVDEVLAVGDAEFQKKCLGKIETVAEQGRTVLFVSHNMQYVTRLCERIILMDEGKIVEDGPAARAVSRYLRSDLGTMAAREWPANGDAPGNDVVRLRAVRVREEAGAPVEAVDIWKAASIELEYDILRPDVELVPWVQLTNEPGTIVFTTVDTDRRGDDGARSVGRYVSSVVIPGNLLAEGVYVAAVGLRSLTRARKHVIERDAVAFRVVDRGEGSSARGGFAGRMPGVVRPKLRWETRFEGGRAQRS